MSSSCVCRRYPPSVYIRSSRSAATTAAAAVYYNTTNSHIMSTHKTLSKTERRRRWQRRSTNIYVIILYIGFHTFFLQFIYYYFSCWPSSRPLHAKTWKNYYMRNTSRGHTIIILLCDGATWRLYIHVYNNICPVQKNYFRRCSRGTCYYYQRSSDGYSLPRCI